MISFHPYSFHSHIILYYPGMKDVQLVILNNDSQQCGVGELGEIYVRSSHLARGYKGLEEQTREKFFVNPFRTHDREDRFYRTGDLGRYM